MKCSTCLVIIAVGFICNISLKAAAQNQSIQKQKFNLSKQIEDEVGYTHAVKADNVLYISGTVATGDMTTQLKEIMENIKRTLGQFGADFSNVVKENVYTTNLDSFIAIKSIRNAYYNKDYPAATWVEVNRLYLSQYKIEIEVVAQLPK